MNPIRRTLRNTWAAIGRGAKAFTMRFQGSMQWFGGFLPRTTFDYAAEVGDGLRSNIIVAALNWIARNFPEAPVAVADRATDELIAPHPMTDKIDRPNPYYSGVLLWMATIIDWTLNGNAYWLHVPTGDGRVGEIWWVPSWMMEPKWPQDGSVFLSGYVYSPNGIPIPIPTDQVVHFRFGLDPNNPRKGLGMLGPLLREIFTDEEAANFTATVLRNTGIPGVLISPEGAVASTEDADEVRDTFRAKFTGDKRGEAMVMKGPTKVQRLSFSPQEMNLRELRRIPEERVSAVLGIPSAVIGFGSGLEQTKVGATMAELREMAYENFIIPTQRILAAELDQQLLPHFADEARQKTVFDTSKVRVLQDDQNALATRHVLLLNGGAETRAECRAALGLEVTPEDEVWHLPFNIVEVPVGQAPALLQLPAAASRKARGLGVGRAQRQGAAQRIIAPALSALAEAVIGDVLEPALVGVRARGNGHAKTLADSVFAAFDRVLRSVQVSAILTGTSVAAGQVNGTPLVEDGPGFGMLLERAGRRITGIDNETRRAVVAQIDAGRAEGQNAFQIAEGLRDSHSFSMARAEAIARTEVAALENASALATWRNEGVIEVDIIDGDQDEECASRNGTRVPLSSEPDLAHPNCTLVVLPVVGE